MVKFLSRLIHCYKRYLSPLLGPHCRFYPGCSSYFLQALETHGAAKGSLLGLRRICRCHPMSEGGIDLVPGTDLSQCPNHTSHPSLSCPELPANPVNHMHKESPISHGY